MIVQDFVESLRAEGAELSLSNGQLVIEAPRGLLNEERIQQLRMHKPEIVALLSATLPKPYIDDKGGLHIPMRGDPKYHWWNKGQCLEDTLRELGASAEVWERYTNEPFPDL